MSLKQLGWRDSFTAHLESGTIDPDLRPARVIEVHRRGLCVHDGTSEIKLPSFGRWYHTTKESLAPTVGDWLLLSASQPSKIVLLPRANDVKRTVTHRPTPQSIAANVDILFVVMSCNDDFNESKLERFLTLAEVSRARPHVVLSKRDLEPNFDAYVECAKSICFDISVSPVNCLDFDTLSELRVQIKPGLTVLFVGSSGVGKSTLLNTLIGSDRQETQATRLRDHKGRHTTSRRNLFILANGGILIDVPGIREIALWGTAESLPQTFPDIETWIQACRFVNCTHTTNETGCAVQAAIQNDSLSDRRLQNYFNLRAQLTTK